MSDSMVERVARAIRTATVTSYEDIARIAIEAMREPTEAMKQTGFELTGDPCWQEDVGKAWQAMIDEALK